MKSFLLSIVLTGIFCFYFMSLFDKKINSFYRNMPEWLIIPILIIFFIGYAVAFYWGIKGITKEYRLFNFFGICFSLLGIGLYVLGFVMQAGSGKERPGQFDYSLDKIVIDQRKALDSLLQQTNTLPAQVKMVAYWGMHKNADDFVVCVQQGNIIGLQIKNKNITDVQPVSALKFLSWLVLENCNLKTIENLQLPRLERLYVNHNQLTSLNGIQHSPKVSWVNFRDNPVTDSSALQQLTNTNLNIVNQ